ncbi:MAG: VWA domain-containing protein [Muribaculaceae bacterium]|nr:VWA domain-containing protein [Muribaculaceae bacterium]
MFNFAYPLHLYLLALVPVLILLFLAARASRRAKLKRFGRPEIVEKMMPDASRYTPAVRIALQAIAIAALVIVVARPRTEGTVKTETAAGIEIVVAFDLSNSMLASSTDRADGVSRLDRAKLLLERLIDRLDNDKVGLVIFAGSSKVQLPVTSDFYTAKMYLNDLTPEMMGYQGTDIAAAIRMSMNCFSGVEDMHRAIILITDSEDHEGAAVEAARLAAENGIQVDVIGLGTPSGALVPGITDGNGQPVRSALNEDLARQIAEAGHGVYVNGASSGALSALTDQLDTLAKSEFDTVVYSAASEQFPTFAAIALIFLIIDIFVVDRKISWLRGIEFFNNRNRTAAAKAKKSK